MGHLYERSPLGEIKEKGNRKKRGGAMGLGPMRGAPTPLGWLPPP